MPNKSNLPLTEAELQDFRRLSGIMVPPAVEFSVPGADDPKIFDDIVRSLGRDREAVRQALVQLREMAGEDFSGLDESRARTTAMALLDRHGPIVIALGRAVLQCYYRDGRVMAALGLEARAPFPKGHALEPGDWSLLDVVRGRPRMWRDVEDAPEKRGERS